MKKNQRTLLSLIFFSSFIFHNTYAADIPNAIRSGVVAKSFEEQKAYKYEKSLPEIQKKESKEEEQIDDSQKIAVSSIKFTGNTVFSTKKLNKLIEPFIADEMTLKSLYELCEKINTKYREKGFFLAKAFLPAQEIKDGTVLISVREVNLGDVRVEGNNYYKDQFIQKHFNSSIYKPVNYNSLIKNLLIINEYPELNVRSFFEKGSDPGTTDIILKTSDANLFHAYFDYNNFGSEFVSKDRGTLTLDYGNLIMQGDQIKLRGAAGNPTDALNFGELNYNIPFFSPLLKFNVSYIFSKYKVGKEFEDLKIEGESNNYKTGLKYILLRSKTQNSDFFLEYDHKSIKNFILNEETSNDELRIGSLGLSYDKVDRLKGRTFYNIKFSKGIPGFSGGLEKNDPSASREGAGGDFSKWNLNVTRIQQSFFSTFFILKGIFQETSDILPSSEELAIGGINSVRGYEQSKNLGDRGYNFSLEYRFQIPFIGKFRVPFMEKTWQEFVQLKIFWDYGKAYLENETLIDDEFELEGAGAGIQISFPRQISLSLDVGFPLNDEFKDEGEQVYLKIDAKLF